MNNEKIYHALQQNPWVLAPLTQGGNLPFRRLCLAYGAGITFSEMVYAHKLLKSSRREWALTRRHPDEPCFGVQIAASKPHLAKDAAAQLSEHPIDFIDLNCGCPIRDAVNKGLGARLLEKPTLLYRILSAMREGSKVPVTVKLRLGFKEQKINIKDTIQASLDAGVAWITIHGRTRDQRYNRPADWGMLRELAATCPVPLIGNGDILTWYEGIDRIQESTIQGAMLARGALIKPWLFQELTQQQATLTSFQQRLEAYHLFGTYLKEHLGDDEFGLKRAKQFFVWHLDFFSRFIPLPEPQYRQQSREYPLMQTRFDPKELLPDPVSRFFALAQEAEREAIAVAIVESQSSNEALTKLEQEAKAFNCNA